MIYSTDSEHGPEARNPNYRFVDFFQGADILIFDGQYTFQQATTDKRNWGHSDHITAVELAARAQVKQLIIFHHEPAHEDSDIEKVHAGSLQFQSSYNQENYPQRDSLFPRRIILAYDGLVIHA